MPSRRGASSSIIPVSDALADLSPDQKRFEQALQGEKTRIAALCKTIRPWGGSRITEIVDATVFHCGLYYAECLPRSAPRRSRAKLKAEIRKAVALADRLSTALRSIWSSQDPTVYEWLAPVMLTRWSAGDGIRHVQPLDPALLRSLDELRRCLAQLDQALPDDRGGRRTAVAFENLVRWLAGIHCHFTGSVSAGSLFGYVAAKAAPISTKGHFFRYVGAVAELLQSVQNRFPAAKFDLPSGNDALRKSLERLAARRDITWLVNDRG